MEVQKEAFVGLMEYYKLLPIENKRSEVIKELEELISNYSLLCSKMGIMPNIMLNKEMLNIKRPDLSEDEFLEAVYSYINALEDISAQFIVSTINMVESKQ